MLAPQGGQGQDIFGGGLDQQKQDGGGGGRRLGGDQDRLAERAQPERGEEGGGGEGQDQVQEGGDAAEAGGS